PVGCRRLPRKEAARSLPSKSRQPLLSRPSQYCRVATASQQLMCSTAYLRDLRTAETMGLGSSRCKQARPVRVPWEVLTAKQAPPRPGTAPALGLRAGADGLLIVSQPTS